MNPHAQSVLLPAESMRGAVFCTDFRDALTMAKDGWNVFGAPTYHPNGGAILDGAADYFMRPLNGELNSDELTFHVEFWPDFEADDGATSYLFDTDAGAGRCSVIKHSANTLLVRAGNGIVLSASLATFQAYWITSGRNLLSVSLSPGSNALRFNGYAIASSGTLWAPGASTQLTVGAYGNGVSNWFDGTISRLTIGHHTSTLAEHTAYWNHSMWNWENLLDVNLQFRHIDYDPTNVRTLDSSNNGNHATLGDGAGTGEPTQADGYMEFDGVNDYLSGIADPTGAFTVLGYEDTGIGWTFFSDNDLTHWTPIMTSGGFTGNLAFLQVAPSVLNPTQLLDAEWKYRTRMGGKF